MQDVMPLVGLALGVLAAVWAAWAAGRRFGLMGLVVPGLVGAGWAWRAMAPLGHAEEAMGRGLEQMFLWLPLFGLTLGASVLGAVVRARRTKG